MGDLFNPTDNVSKLKFTPPPKEASVYNPTFDVEGVQEPLALSRPSMAQSFTDGIKSAIPYTLDYTYLKGAWDNLDRPEDEGDLLMPDELKEMGIDSKEPMTTWQAQIETNRLLEIEEADKVFGQSFRSETPLNAAAVLAGQLLTYAFSPSSWVLGFGFHAGIKGSVQAARLLQKPGALKAFESMGTAAKLAAKPKLDTTKKHFLFGEKFLSNGMYPALPSTMENMTEALLVHGEHADFGNNYDVTPELYGSVFLPALLVGGSNVLRKRFSKGSDLSSTEAPEMGAEIPARAADREAETVIEEVATPKPVEKPAETEEFSIERLLKEREVLLKGKSEEKTRLKSEKMEADKKMRHFTQSRSEETLLNRLNMRSAKWDISFKKAIAKKTNLSGSEAKKITDKASGELFDMFKSTESKVKEATKRINAIKDKFYSEVSKIDKDPKRVTDLRIKMTKSLEGENYKNIVDDFNTEVQALADRYNIKIDKLVNTRVTEDLAWELRQSAKFEKVEAEKFEVAVKLRIKELELKDRIKKADDQNKVNELRQSFNKESRDLRTRYEKEAKARKEAKEKAIAREDKAKAKEIERQEKAKEKELKEKIKAKEDSLKEKIKEAENKSEINALRQAFNKESKDLKAKYDELNKESVALAKEKTVRDKRIKNDYTYITKAERYKVLTTDPVLNRVYTQINRAVRSGNAVDELKARREYYELLPEIIRTKEKQLKQGAPEYISDADSWTQKLGGQIDKLKYLLSNLPRRLFELEKELGIKNKTVPHQQRGKIFSDKASEIELRDFKPTSKSVEVLTASVLKRRLTDPRAVALDESGERLQHALNLIKGKRGIAKQVLTGLPHRDKVFVRNMHKIHKRFPDFIDKLSDIISDMVLVDLDVSKIDSLYPFLGNPGVLAAKLRSSKIQTTDDLLNFTPDDFDRFLKTQNKTDNALADDKGPKRAKMLGNAEKKSVVSGDENIDKGIDAMKQTKNVADDYKKCIIGGEEAFKAIPPPKPKIS